MDSLVVVMVGELKCEEDGVVGVVIAVVASVMEGFIKGRKVEGLDIAFG